MACAEAAGRWQSAGHTQISHEDDEYQARSSGRAIHCDCATRGA